MIQSVFLEEMLHLTLAANILNAIGGSPQLDKPGIMPTLPDLPAAQQRSVRGLAREVLEGGARDFPEDRETGASTTACPRTTSSTRSASSTRQSRRPSRRLTEELGEQTVFSGDPARQITDELYYGGSGRIIAVSDLASALAALEEIVEQGEGLQHHEIWDGDRDMFHPEREEVAHYFRFNELVVGRVPGEPTRRSRARPVRSSRSTGTPSTTCVRTRARATTRKAARSGRHSTSSTTRTRAASTFCTSASTAARGSWPSRLA